MQIIQTILLVILVDRNLILRDRYKIAIESNMPTKYIRGSFAIWVYCKKSQNDQYMRNGGRRLLAFSFGERLTEN